jgi:hypothetical protein
MTSAKKITTMILISIGILSAFLILLDESYRHGYSAGQAKCGYRWAHQASMGYIPDYMEHSHLTGWMVWVNTCD